jgi:hypothetical protein
VILNLEFGISDLEFIQFGNSDSLPLASANGDPESNQHHCRGLQPADSSSKFLVTEV